MSWWDKLTNWWNPNDDENNTGFIYLTIFMLISFHSFEEFRLNDSLSIEEKTKLYQAIGYKDEQSNQRISYPSEV
jgi:hypothetical protein